MNGTWWVQATQLNAEQRDIVNLRRGESHLILGPPGSGKTNLLLLRMEFLNRAGEKNCKIVVFTRPLRGFLISCPTGYRPDPSRVQTLRSWQASVINELGGKLSECDDFEAARSQNAATLLALLEENDVGEMFDCVFLDEAQDYLPDEILGFKKISRQVFAVADNRQQIYSNSNAIDELRGFCNVHSLRSHYRNGRKICSFADKIGRRWNDYQSMSATSMYNEISMPSSVTCSDVTTIEIALQQIVESIEIQLDAYPGELIGVLTPRTPDLATIATILRRSNISRVLLVQPQHGDDDEFLVSEHTRVCLCTVHGAKGLEFRAVHFVSIEKCKAHRERQWNVAYTGITRAKTSLSLYPTGRIPGHFETAIASLEEQREPSLEDLF